MNDLISGFKILSLTIGWSIAWQERQFKVVESELATAAFFQICLNVEYMNLPALGLKYCFLGFENYHLKGVVFFKDHDKKMY